MPVAALQRGCCVRQVLQNDGGSGNFKAFRPEARGHRRSLAGSGEQRWQNGWTSERVGLMSRLMWKEPSRRSRDRPVRPGRPLSRMPS
jgi:hypothetical protein